jgi:phospholipid transport system substrate-binding protein
MPVSRRALLTSALLTGGWIRPVLAADAGGGPPEVVQRFYDNLLSVMKEAKHLSFDQRYQRLAPAIGQAFNLPLIVRLSVGPDWTKLQPSQQQALTEVFARYTISVYANRFDDFNGERFIVDPAPVTNPNGAMVQTSLVKSDGDKVILNYLLRQDADGGWQIIDIYLSGTISELAARRSEYMSVVRQSGADGLVKLIEQRTAALHTG